MLNYYVSMSYDINKGGFVGAAVITNASTADEAAAKALAMVLNPVDDIDVRVWTFEGDVPEQAVGHTDVLVSKQEMIDLGWEPQPL